MPRKAFFRPPGLLGCLNRSLWGPPGTPLCETVAGGCSSAAPLLWSCRGPTAARRHAPAPGPLSQPPPSAACLPLSSGSALALRSPRSCGGRSGPGGLQCGPEAAQCFCACRSPKEACGCETTAISKPRHFTLMSPTAAFHFRFRRVSVLRGGSLACCCRRQNCFFKGLAERTGQCHR